MITQDLKKLLFNKKIALVGNAVSLLQKEYGKDIDNHDIVCRINKGPLLCNQMYKKSHGMRTDILFYGNPAIISETICNLSNEIIYILTHLKYNDKKHPDGNLYKISQSQYNKFKFDSGYKEKGKWPSCGLIAILLLVELNPKFVSIYGFDWKETPTFYDDKTKENEFRHDFELEKNLIKNFSNILRIR